MQISLAEVAAAAAVLVASDLVYTLDHYFVHHDRERYRQGHARHHRRYNGAKDAPQLDDYEIATYVSASLVSMAALSVLSLLTGHVGCFAGATLKLAHSLLFHLYQHRWWGEVPLRKQQLGPPRRGWGLASARYHAFHHSHPSDEVFTYTESWAGFDRLLEWAHPVLVRFTADARAERTRASRPETS
jgi:hypothetical protein